MWGKYLRRIYKDLKKNNRLYSKVKKAIDAAGEIHFKNEIFSIKKTR